MASLILHQIIGEKYCKINNIIEYSPLLDGNIAPDILPNKEANHYTEKKQYVIYLDAVSNRVNLQKFCQQNDINSPYNLGYFLHLVTDFIFYDKLLINNPTYATFVNLPFTQSSALMYKEYDRVANFVLNLFPHTDISKLPDFATTISNETLTIFNQDDLIKFIDVCSNVNLDKLYKEVKDNNYSTLNSIKF